MAEKATNGGELIEQVTQASGFESLAPPLQVAIFLGALVLLSSALVSVTSFTRIVIVLSFVRRALTTQEIPPNQVIIGLSLFLTFFTMGPTLDSIHDKALAPYLAENKTSSEALKIGVDELRHFMLKHTRKNDLALFIHMSEIEAPQTPNDTPMRVLIPAFIISELKTAFTMGFCLFIPFILIDLVVSTVLMSLGMMMMPPVVISLPFKILLFVLVDGWHLVARALGASFA
jgi:flagellar biosynthetic protein FliP